MGSVLTGVFGGGSSTDQKTRPDETAQALNNLTLQQLSGLFQGTPAAEFGKDQPQLSTLSSGTQSLIDQAAGGGLININDYINLALNEGSNFISKVATPQILSTAALQGLEGGGFVPESIGKATAGIALPFLQSLPGAAQGFAGAASQLTGLSDLPRQLKQEEFLRRQGFVTSGLTGIPFSPGSKTTGSTSQKPLFNFFGFG